MPTGILPSPKKRLDDLIAGEGGENFRLQDLGCAFMAEAIMRDCSPFISEILYRGIPFHWSYAREAIKSKARDSLDLFLERGWEINKPLNEFDPPLLA